MKGAIDIKQMKKKEYYYVFICLDSIPTLELMLDDKKKHLKNPLTVNWQQTKYIILDFSTKIKSDGRVVEKGNVKYNNHILTNKLVYIQINISKAHEIEIDQIKNEYTKWERDLIKLALVLFESEPIEFIAYVKKNQLLSETDIKKLEKSSIQLNEEKEILDSWKNIS